MGLEDGSRRSGHGAHRELVRLRRSGLIQWNKQARHWTIAETHQEGIRAALEGRIFGVS
jgi:hypothetical protein